MRSDALARLWIVWVGDASRGPLREKLLERRRLLAKIAALVGNGEHSDLIGYNKTELERDIALTLGMGMYGSDPRLSPLGTKTGCRRLFGEVGVQYPLGAEDLHGLDEDVDAIGELLVTRPTMRQVIVKLNDGVSGAGNALVEARRSGRAARVGTPPRRSRRRVEGMRLEAEDVPFDGVRGEARVRRRHRGGAHHRRRAPEPERAAAGAARRDRRAPVHARSAPRRRQRRELPRLHVPRRPGVLAPHQPPGDGGRQAPRGGGGARAVRRRLRGRSGCRRRMVAVRDRAQPAQGRHDASVPDPPVPDRRPVRRALGPLPHPGGGREAPRGDRPPRGGRAPGALGRRPVRRGRQARPPLRPVPAGRHRLPHDQLDHRARPGRDDRGRRHP